MFAATFIRLVEDEYLNLHDQCNEIKGRHGFDLFTKPLHMCEKVQKFRNWLTMAIRSAEITKGGIPARPEDVLLDASSARVPTSPEDPLHPNIISSLTLFEKTDLVGLLGERRLLTFEKATGVETGKCMFKVCYSHCQFVSD